MAFVSCQPLSPGAIVLKMHAFTSNRASIFQTTFKYGNSGPTGGQFIIDARHDLHQLGNGVAKTAFNYKTCTHLWIYAKIVDTKGPDFGNYQGVT